MSMTDLYDERSKEIRELRELNAELLEELSNLSDIARVAMLKANNHGAGYDIDGILDSAEQALAKAEAFNVFEFRLRRPCIRKGLKTKCELGDKLKFPDGTEYLFLGYFDDQAVIIDRSGDDPKMRVVCKCCMPKLHELIVEPSNDTNPTH